MTEKSSILRVSLDGITEDQLGLLYRNVVDLLHDTVSVHWNCTVIPDLDADHDAGWNPDVEMDRLTGEDDPDFSDFLRTHGLSD